jgi:hypothetical protein
MQITKLKDKGLFVHVTENEALGIIKSLTTQILDKSTNTGRLESHTEDGAYFSIGVDYTKEQVAQSIERLQKIKFIK